MAPSTTHKSRLSPMRVGAERTHLLLRQGSAAATATDPRHGIRPCNWRQAQAASRIALQQVKGDALRRLGTDAGQTPQRMHQLTEKWALGHGNGPRSEGQLHPRRQGRPAVSVLRHALARTVDGGGDEILEHLLVVAHQSGVDLHPTDQRFMVTLTIPPPDSPMTSSWASRSWASFMSSASSGLA